MDLVRDPTKVRAIPFRPSWMQQFRPIDWHTAKLRPIIRAGKSLLRQHCLDPWLNLLLSQRGLNVMHRGWANITDDEACRHILRFMDFEVVCSDINQNAGSVLSVDPSQVVSGTVSAAVVAGDAVTQNSSNLWAPGTAAGTAIQSGTTGVGVATASAPGPNQPINVWKSGSMILGAINAGLAIGQVYCISLTGNGNICPYSDLASTNYPTILGMASTANILVSPPGGCFALGVAKA